MGRNSRLRGERHERPARRREGAPDRAERDRAEHEALEDAEDAGENRLRDCPLQERDPRNVRHRVPDPDHSEEDQRGRRRRPGSDQRDRQAPQDEPDPEARRDPAPSDERRSRGGGAE